MKIYKKIHELQKFNLFIHYGELFVLVRHSVDEDSTMSIVRRLAWWQNGEWCGQTRDISTQGIDEDTMVQIVQIIE